MENIRVKDVHELTVFNKGLGQNKGFVWRVGNKYKPGGVHIECTRIIHDTNAYHFHEQSRWVIFVAPIVDGKADLDKESEYIFYENVEIEAKRDIRKIFVV